MTVLLLVTRLTLAADACPERDTWPAEAWADASATVASERPEALAALDAYLFSPDLDRADPERRGVRTDGVVIVHHGQIVYERYGGGYTADTPHLAWSASKSFTNALVGVAAREGRLDLEDSICEHLDVFDKNACAVRVVDLLEFASGFDWLETYEGYSPTASSVLAMLYGQGHDDMADFVARHALRDRPGTTWMYSSGDSNVLAAVAGAALAPGHGDRFPWAVLFDPLGMRSAVWERDGAGTYVGSSYLFATPRDYARFGYLLLNDGCWAGERLLPAGWVADSTQVSEPFRRRPYDHDGGSVQGRQFWLNRPVPELGLGLPWPGVPEGAFAALGHWKQGIYVVPDADLVVVRTGDDRDGRSFSHAELLRLALALVGEAAERGPEPAPYETIPAPASPRRYDNSLFELASGFAAEQVCSCLFVMGRDEDYCAEWARVSPEVARFKVDHAARTVTARALGMGRQVARYEDAQTGCRLLGD